MKHCLLFLTILSCFGTFNFANANDNERCQALVNLKFDDAKIIKTELIADRFTPPSNLADSLRNADTKEISHLPQICRIELVIQPKINVEVWLPTQWNHRLQAIGGGGYAGFIPFDELAVAVQGGYAAMGTDTGHSGNLFEGDFVFKNNQLQADTIADFAYRSVHEMTIKTKQIIQAYYGKPADYSYWNGCSTGGRQGLMEAQRFPADYDGIYIVAPAIQWDKFIPSELWPQVVMQKELGHPIDTHKLIKLRKAIIQLADEQDGIKDGIINDPTALEISDNFLKEHNFNNAEIIALRKIWQGPTNQLGESLWFGVEKTAPQEALAGSEPFPIPVDYLKYWIAQNPNLDWKNMDYQSFVDYFNESVDLFRPIMGTDNPDLSQFKKSGGKMIIWHGWDDRLIPPKGTIHYYNHVVKLMGGQKRTDEFVKLYMAPGVDHCNGGDGADQINGFKSLVNWVEKQQPPKNLTAKKIENGNLILQRPLCAYPQKTVYKGEGNANNPANFECQ